MQLNCGYPIKNWNSAKWQIKAVLIDRAKARDIISYVELTAHVTAIQLEPQSFALTTMLREIAPEEHAAGRGLLTALVVYSSGNMQPGPGFFDELKRVHAFWSTARLSGSKKKHEVTFLMTVG
jgi:hypothetical protein